MDIGEPLASCASTLFRRLLSATGFPRRRDIRCVALVMWVAVLVPSPAVATEPFAKVAVSAGQVLTFPRGVRNLAMGWTGAADDADPSNVFYNPANIFLQSDIAVTEGHNSWPVDLDFFDIGGFGGTAIRRNDRTAFHLAAGLRYTKLRLDVAEVRTIFLPDGTGRAFDDDWYLTMALAGGLSVDWFDVGLGFSAKSFSEAGRDAWAFDLGVLAKARIATAAGFRLLPSIGVSVLNLGGEVDYGSSVSAQLPEQARLGLGLRIETPSVKSWDDRLGYTTPLVTFSTSLDYMNRLARGGSRSDDGTGFGFEMGLSEILFVRVGHKDRIRGTGTSGTTYGLGAAWRVWALRLGVDYARFPTNGFGGDVDAYGASLAMSL